MRAGSAALTLLQLTPLFGAILIGIALENPYLYYQSAVELLRNAGDRPARLRMSPMKAREARC